MFAKIVVPVDLSQIDNAHLAIKLAQKLRNDDGIVLLLNVVEDIPMNVAAQIPVGALEGSEKHALADLKKVAEEAGIDAEVEVRTGAAASAILDLAEDKEADLIIVASHRPGLRDYFLGSTAARVVRHAQCPVFVNR